MKHPKIGIYEKFVVTRADGQSAPGQKHHGCTYFVLDVTHDPFARDALMAYAVACAGRYPALALDIGALVAGELHAPFPQEPTGADGREG